MKPLHLKFSDIELFTSHVISQFLKPNYLSVKSISIVMNLKLTASFYELII